MEISKVVNKPMTITDFMIYISINLIITTMDYLIQYYVFI